MSCHYNRIGVLLAQQQPDAQHSRSKVGQRVLQMADTGFLIL